MSYCEAMEAAGAEILCYKSFGSYQGDWWTKVKYNGNTFWVHGSYGSCSGCDAFQAEFDREEEQCHEHLYNYQHEPCVACDKAKETYTEKLADFGKSYLVAGEYTQKEAEKQASDGWYGGEGQLEYLQANTLEEL